MESFAKGSPIARYLGLLVCIIALQGEARANQTIRIGTAGSAGIYHAIGSAICKYVEKNNGTTPESHCSAELTSGSIENIERLREGRIEFGIVQSDWQHHAYHGSSQYEDTAVADLRSVFSLHQEPFQIVVAKETGISSWNDLKNKRVNIGTPGSGQRGTFEELMMAHNIDGSFFSEVRELTPAEQNKALCSRHIDAFGYSTGYPSAEIAAAKETCGAQIINLSGAVIDKLVEKTPYYMKMTIPGGIYPQIPEDVETFGVLATFVTSAKLPDVTVYNLVRAVFENIEDFKKSHPALENLKPKQMVHDGLSAPLHPGAEKYYKKRGWNE